MRAGAILCEKIIFEKLTFETLFTTFLKILSFDFFLLQICFGHRRGTQPHAKTVLKSCTVSTKIAIMCLNLAFHNFRPLGGSTLRFRLLIGIWPVNGLLQPRCDRARIGFFRNFPKNAISISGSGAEAKSRTPDFIQVSGSLLSCL